MDLRESAYRQRVIIVQPPLADIDLREGQAFHLHADLYVLCMIVPEDDTASALAFRYASDCIEALGLC